MATTLEVRTIIANLGVSSSDIFSQPVPCHDLELTSSPFALVILEIVYHFLPRSGWTKSPYFMLPAIAGMTDVHHHTKLLVEMGSCKLPAQADLEP
jgi:hypothetical protein